MKNKLICVDYMDAEGEWQKEWSSLYANTEIVTLDAVCSANKVDAHVLFVHASALINYEGLNDPRIVKLIPKLPAAGCIGVVSASGKDSTVINQTGRICEVRTRFPSGRMSLQTLESRIVELVEAVTKAQCSSERHKAWLEFDAVKSNECTTALSVLCQGYLTIIALAAGNGNFIPSNDAVRKAMLATGICNGSEQDFELKLIEAIESLNLQNLPTVPDADYWLAPFRNCEMDDESLLRTRLLLELGAPLPQQVDRFVSELERIPPGEVSVELVSAVYLELHLQTWSGIL
jgi:hypothetical protein